MPYSKEHKEKTKEKILTSARKLFSTKGFEGVSVNEVMQDCQLTRGAFYAHFESKSHLYKDALTFSVSNNRIVKEKPSDISRKEWLNQLLDWYLSIEHLKGNEPCPLAFLATDIATRDVTTRKVYADAYKGFNHVIMMYASEDEKKENTSILSLTSMIIGAVAIARTIEDKILTKNILDACRQQTRKILND